MEGPSLELNDPTNDPVLQPILQTVAAAPQPQEVSGQAAEPSSAPGFTLHPESTDFWNSAAVGATDLNAAPMSFVSEVVIAKKKSDVSPQQILAGLGLAIFAGFGWNFVVNDETPDVTLAHLVSMLTGESHEAAAPVAAPKLQKQAAVATATVEDTEEPSRPRPVPGQTSPEPYAHLKNDLAAAAEKRVGPMSADEENGWRTAFESPNYYQHYKAVLEIAAARKDGSEDMLRDALQNGRFWMRMYAVMALADLGYKMNEMDVVTALGDAHGELRERFLSRFEKAPCGQGCMFVVRGAISHLTASGRLQALKVLGREDSTFSADYMVAATFDEDPHVRQYARQWLLSKPVEEADWWRVYDAIFFHQPEAPATDATAFNG